ncbi:ABC transporter substrate-binding protein [Oerskovia sp. M15]
MYPELDIEAIVALEPDLVLAPQTGIDQATYDQLAAFTEVVAYPEGPWITPIDEQIEIAAQALGKPDEAAGLIAGIDDSSPPPPRRTRTSRARRSPTSTAGPSRAR